MVSQRHSIVSRRQFALAALACALLPGTLLPAAVAAQPVTRLTLRAADGTSHVFDDAALARLPWHDIVTHTAWTEGPQLFRGPRLADVLSPFAGPPIALAQRRLRLTALNDFVIEIPASDAWTFDPILAREANGVPMRVRDKGPLWLVYPRDSLPALQDPLMDERWIWQIRLIEVL
ncbi:hypothetical protein LCM17_12210 [Cereibacter sphaeroides]|nr:hypothetical protein [Cereibacter sphaeroides]